MITEKVGQLERIWKWLTCYDCLDWRLRSKFWCHIKILSFFVFTLIEYQWINTVISHSCTRCHNNSSNFCFLVNLDFLINLSKRSKVCFEWSEAICNTLTICPRVPESNLFIFAPFLSLTGNFIWGFLLPSVHRYLHISIFNARFCPWPSVCNQWCSPPE